MNGHKEHLRDARAIAQLQAKHDHRGALRALGRNLARHALTAHLAAAMGGLGIEAELLDAHQAADVIGAVTDPAKFAPPASVTDMPALLEARKGKPTPAPGSVFQVRRGQSFASIPWGPGLSVELEAGATWRESLTVPAGKLMGTAAARVRIGRFGPGPNPLIAPENAEALSVYGGAFFDIDGIDAVPLYDRTARVVTACTLGINFWTAGQPACSNFRLLNSTIGGATVGLNIMSPSGVNLLRGVTIRDCDEDNRPAGTHPHAIGCYVDGASGSMLMELCTLLRNGILWPTVFRRGLYRQTTCADAFEMRNSISALGGSDGGQYRGGGEIHHNLYIGNPIACVHSGGGRFADNAVWGTRNIANLPDRSLDRQHGPQFAVGVAGRRFVCDRNLLLEDRTDSSVNHAPISCDRLAIPLDVGRNVVDGFPTPPTIEGGGSLVMDTGGNRWSGTVRSGPKPTWAAYLASKGLAGTTRDDFLGHLGKPGTTAAEVLSWLNLVYGMGWVN